MKQLKGWDTRRLSRVVLQREVKEVFQPLPYRQSLRDGRTEVELMPSCLSMGKPTGVKVRLDRNLRWLARQRCISKPGLIWFTSVFPNLLPAIAPLDVVVTPYSDCSISNALIGWTVDRGLVGLKTVNAPHSNNATLFYAVRIIVDSLAILYYSFNTMAHVGHMRALPQKCPPSAPLSICAPLISKTPPEDPNRPFAAHRPLPRRLGLRRPPED
ncbi:hypothetical protein M514_23201 [Trichuris suis]|uniref:Uncharacterized protein n=1 Tax=Trichuris suis TaxID=68888 RepID=A0A085N553_9BILA|nr:hypothetical protein M514_23201 [Trichuris suis]